jgi:hypothetical protein
MLPANCSSGNRMAERATVAAVAAEQARGWAGFKLDEIGGATVGKVEGVLVDARSLQPSWILFRLGWLGHRSAIPSEFSAAAAGRLWTPYSRETIRAAPEVDPAAGLDYRREVELCDHFGLAPGAWRRRQLEGREGDRFTSIPG